MKLIDKKGKLFGIINIIDLMVILVFALLIVGGASRMKSKPVVTSQTTKAYIDFEVEDVRMATVENIVVGDDLYHYDRGGYIGKIVEVEHRPYTEPLEFEGKWINAELPNKYVVSFRVEAEVNDNPDVIVVGGEQTRVGVQYRVKNKKIAFFGTVLNMDILNN